MKPPAFEYFAPASLQEALDLLDRYGEEAKVLAGGQSLMPLMNLRLARPKVIIDVNGLHHLASISADPNGGLTLGGLTRQRAVERSGLVQERNPLLAAALPLIGHFQIRNRGTIGGSLVHADPAAELPAVSLALGAEFVLRSVRSERAVRAEDFFLDTMTTAIQPNELLTEIRLPGWRPRLGWAVEEVARRKGDFAIVGACTLLELDEDDLCKAARIALFGVAGKPLRMQRAEAALRGSNPDERLLAEACRLVFDDLDPDSDVHASATYRREAGGVLARRALETALRRARENSK